ncbi:MAG: hypothetical protein JJT78_18550 [Leptospira sp.]|nr:hypothetical protein [Leptospira sp.]
MHPALPPPQSATHQFIRFLVEALNRFAKQLDQCNWSSDRSPPSEIVEI